MRWVSRITRFTLELNTRPAKPRWGPADHRSHGVGRHEVVSSSRASVLMGGAPCTRSRDTQPGEPLLPRQAPRVVRRS